MCVKWAVLCRQPPKAGRQGRTNNAQTVRTPCNGGRVVCSKTGGVGESGESRQKIRRKVFVVLK